MTAKTFVLLVGLVALTVGGFLFFTEPLCSVTFENPRPVTVIADEPGYRVVTYVDGCGPYPGAPLSISFTATPYEWVCYRVGVLEWTVWEVTD